MNSGSASTSHAPDRYDCPVCAALAGRTISVGDLAFGRDAVPKDYGDVAIVMNPLWWPRNPGSVIVVPTRHYENVFDLPTRLGGDLQLAVHDAATALRATEGCAGVTVRQNNEPGGDQEVWHFHIHVIPRHGGDGLRSPRPAPAPAHEFGTRASRLKEALRGA